MKKIKITFILSIILILCIAITYIAYAQAGTNEDPVVTLSYIKNIFKPELKEETSFKIVNISRGDFIRGDEGTEMILRSGLAQVVSTESGGLANVTAGYDATNDSLVERNNHYIVPRNDGRGFFASTDCILLVKGSYTIK